MNLADSLGTKQRWQTATKPRVKRSAKGQRLEYPIMTVVMKKLPENAGHGLTKRKGFPMRRIRCLQVATDGIEYPSRYRLAICQSCRMKSEGKRTKCQ